MLNESEKRGAPASYWSVVFDWAESAFVLVHRNQVQKYCVCESFFSIRKRSSAAAVALLYVSPVSLILLVRCRSIAELSACAIRFLFIVDY